MQIAVIGGGAAGIGAAWVLAKSGMRVTLFEREPALGGSKQESSGLRHSKCRDVIPDAVGDPGSQWCYSLAVPDKSRCDFPG